MVPHFGTLCGDSDWSLFTPVLKVCKMVVSCQSVLSTTTDLTLVRVAPPEKGANKVPQEMPKETVLGTTLDVVPRTHSGTTLEVVPPTGSQTSDTFPAMPELQ